MNSKFKNFKYLALFYSKERFSGDRKLTSKKERAKSTDGNVKSIDRNNHKNIDSDKQTKADIIKLDIYSHNR